MKNILLIGLLIVASSQAFIARAVGTIPPGLTRLSLNGDWQVSAATTNDWIPATVPGCIHTDLLAAKRIPDPFYRDNEAKVQWVGEQAWTYRRTFEVTPDLLQHQHVLLRCEGLDTMATIRLNGQEIGKADNMFRVWEFDVKSVLHSGANQIDITFASPFPYMRSRKAELPPKMRDRSWVRKEPCQFGWDWGPTLVTCGIYKNMGIVAFDTARLSDVMILQDHSHQGRVELQVQVAAETSQSSALRAVVSVRDNQQEVGTAEVSLAAGKGTGTVTIKEPKLWWPAGMGDHPLYTVETRLLDSDGKVLDQSSKRIGLRTLKLLPPDKGTQTPLRFEVNGVQYFSKGANCIPFDSFNTRVTPATLRRYVADAAAANMNTLRFWGGGYYEEDELFDACDEMGIVVWLDFKFACSGYPTADSAFMENVRLEARDQLMRLRHHPCIGVWCGNNEIAMMKAMPRADYDKLFKDLVGTQVKEFAPQANYVPGSPDCGDRHYWSVWHGGKPFEAYRDQSGFMSEFGLQSFPEPKSVRLYTAESDRHSITSPVMVAHEKNAGAKGIGKITKYLQEYFKPAKDFDSTLWQSQIMQAYGIEIGAEAWRQSMPKSMGCVFWQYNDCWPVASWSSVDYYGRWKALQYAARRFYSPLLVSCRPNIADSTIEIFTTSDLLTAKQGQLTWQITDLSGTALASGSESVALSPLSSHSVKKLNLVDQAKNQAATNLLVWVQLTADGKIVSDNLATLAHPKDLNLQNPHIKTAIKQAGESFEVTLQADAPALWTWLTLDGADARYSDNFIHIAPGAPKTITVTPAQTMTLQEFEQALQAHSLYDTSPAQ